MTVFYHFAPLLHLTFEKSATFVRCETRQEVTSHRFRINNDPVYVCTFGSYLIQNTVFLLEMRSGECRIGE